MPLPCFTRAHIRSFPLFPTPHVLDYLPPLVEPQAFCRTPSSSSVSLIYENIYIHTHMQYYVHIHFVCTVPFSLCLLSCLVLCLSGLTLKISLLICFAFVTVLFNFCILLLLAFGGAFVPKNILRFNLSCKSCSLLSIS